MSKAQMSDAFRRIFLYGTLKVGHKNHHLIQDKANGVAKLLCKACTPVKYPLVVATKYNIPFMLNRPGLGAYVTGEVFEIDDKMLQTLDKLEDTGNYYEREVLQFNLGVHEGSIEAFVYVLNKFPEGLLKLDMLADYIDGPQKPYIEPSKRKDGPANALLWKEYGS